MQKYFLIVLLLGLIMSLSAQSDSLKVRFEEMNMISVEQNAEFPGGDGALNKFIAKHAKYPDEEPIIGTMQLRLLINEDGSVSDVQVIKGAGERFDTETVRVIKLLPKFIPAKRNGKPVKSYINLPIKIHLD